MCTGYDGSEVDNVSFWQALKDIAAGERRAKRMREQVGSAARGRHKAIEIDVVNVFKGKSAQELESLSKDILAGVQNGTRADVEYWEAMAAEAMLEANRIIVRERYAEIQIQQLDILNELKDEIAETEEAMAADSGGRVTEGTDFRFIGAAGSSASVDDFEHKAGLGSGGEVDTSAEAVAMEKFEADKNISGDAEEKMALADEFVLADQEYHWQDKYRPRKPRYFNRVRSGYHWNKYNSTHYDSDNPPPKFVLGYKFNIFYPDLIDKTFTPKFFIERCDEPGFAIIRFHAGPPYEDIAFKIVSKQWDTNKRAGFRSLFERGVLQLHFNFKGHWYRR